MAEMKIAIAEDNRQALDMLGNILESDKEIQVVGKAENGTDAYNMIVKTKPDLVFLDVVMPGMDGISFMKAVKERGWDDIVFIILTNLEEFNLARQALSLGAVEYLVKMELTEEKLSEALKLAKERCELTRLANEKASPGFPSKADRIRRLIE